MQLKKIFDLLFLLPKNFFFYFLIFFILTATTIVFELIGFSLLLPLLTMLSNNDIDISSFPSVVPFLNDITVRFFDFDYLINLKSVTIVIFVVFSVKVIFQFALVWISAKIAKNAQHFYAVQLFKSYINKRYKFHQKNSPSILFRNITAEVSNFATTILFGLLSVFVEISILLAMFIFIFFIEPQIMYVILILILIIVTVYSGSKKILLLYGDKRAIFEDKRIAILKSSLENIKDIIVYDLAKVFSDNLSYTNYNLQFAAYIQRLVTSIPRYLFEITGVFILVITIFLFGLFFNLILRFLESSLCIIFKLGPKYVNC